MSRHFVRTCSLHSFGSFPLLASTFLSDSSFNLRGRKRHEQKKSQRFLHPTFSYFTFFERKITIWYKIWEPTVCKCRLPNCQSNFCQGCDNKFNENINFISYLSKQSSFCYSKVVFPSTCFLCQLARTPSYNMGDTGCP